MKNKKLLMIIIAVIAAVAVLTVTVWAATAKPDKADAQPVSEKTQEVEEEKEPKENSTPEIIEEQVLKEETVTDNTETPNINTEDIIEDVVVDETALKDKEVQAQIAKYDSANAGKFKFNRQETVNGKTYDLTFSKVNGFADSKRATVTYFSDNYDGFIYYSDTSELFFMSLIPTSDITAENGIDVNTAEKIAYAFASSKCNLKEYTRYTVKDHQYGYIMSYSKEVSGFMVADFITVTVGFDGGIVGFDNGIGNFDGVVFNPETVKNKIAELAEEYTAENGYKIEDHLITKRDGKVVLESKIIHEDEMGCKGSYIVVSELE